MAMCPYVLTKLVILTDVRARAMLWVTPVVTAAPQWGGLEPLVPTARCIINLPNETVETRVAVGLERKGPSGGWPRALPGPCPRLGYASPCIPCGKLNCLS